MIDIRKQLAILALLSEASPPPYRNPCLIEIGPADIFDFPTLSSAATGSDRGGFRTKKRKATNPAKKAARKRQGKARAITRSGK